MRGSGILSMALATMLANTSLAQAPSECPAPVQSGAWRITDGSGLGTARSADGSFAMALPGGDVATGQVENSCDGRFLLTGQSDDGVPLLFVMEPQDTPLGEPRRYLGRFSYSMFTMTLGITLESDRSANGTFSMEGSGGAAQMIGTMPVRLQNTGAAVSTHAACACRSQLEAFINEEIRGRQLIRDVYANQSLHSRPKSYEPGLYWTPEEYDYVVQRVAGQGMTTNEAVEALEDSVLSGAFEEETAANLEGTGAEGSIRIRAYTDPEDCGVRMGTAHLASCYPDIVRSSTERHEAVHVKNCEAARAGLISEPSYSEAVPTFAAEEIAAYEAEITFLSNWVAENCGG